MAKLIGSVKTGTTESKEATRIEKAKVTSSEAPKTPIGITNPLLAPGQPGREQAEKNIAEREPAIKAFDNVTFKPEERDSKMTARIKAVGNVGSTALKGLMLADERIQGAIAAPMLEALDPFRKDIVQDSVLATIQAIKGERPARFEDVIRAKLPEVKIGGYDVSNPVAMIGGLAAEITAGAGLVKMAGNLIKGGVKTIDSVQKSMEMAEEVRNTAGKAISTLFDGQVGKKQVPVKLLSDIVDTLPEGVLEKILAKPKTFGVLVTKVKDVAGNVIGQTVNSDAKNVWNLRKALDDLLTSKDFYDEATSIGKGIVKNAGNQLRGVLSAVDKQVAPVMEKYSKYAQSLEEVSGIMMKKGRVVVNKAASILKRKGEPGDKIVLERFASLFPSGASMLRDIKVLNRNRMATDAAMYAVKAAVTGAIYGKFIRPTVSVLTGEENSQIRGSGGGE